MFQMVWPEGKETARPTSRAGPLSKLSSQPDQRLWGSSGMVLAESSGIPTHIQFTIPLGFRVQGKERIRIPWYHGGSNMRLINVHVCRPPTQILAQSRAAHGGYTQRRYQMPDLNRLASKFSYTSWYAELRVAD
ncbi:hypothetical protein H4582DRAFT_2063928 [Lactarius indigo]|nr:hypothetical protein H4582DRAFT_2063928 [Lactarius indigo]